MATKFGRRLACVLVVCTGIAWGTVQYGTHTTAQGPSIHLATEKAPGPLGAMQLG